MDVYKNNVAVLHTSFPSHVSDSASVIIGDTLNLLLNRGGSAEWTDSDSFLILPDTKQKTNKSGIKNKKQI